MTPRQSTIFLLWAGEKVLAGDSLTEEESAMFKEAREVSLGMAHRIMRIKPSDYEYTPGKSFD